MKKIMNEQGNALITVLLITVVFTTLGLGIISATIGGAKRTEVRKEDINITYEAIEVIDDFTAELSERIQDKNRNYQISELNKNMIGFNSTLDLLMTDIISTEKYTDRPGVEKIEAEIVSSPAIQEDETLTRVVDLKVTTKAENSSASRTAIKRLIVSPLPSFLKYALGSEDGKLSLNGSPNIVGNVFANNLKLQKEAEYYTKTGQKTIDTNHTSIIGDLYAGEYEAGKFNASAMLDLLKPERFYHQQVPEWKNDSQYQEIYFNTSYEQERTQSMNKNGVENSPPYTSLFNRKDLSGVAGIPAVLQPQITEDKDGNPIYPDPYKVTDSLVNASFPNNLELEGNLLITNTSPMVIDTLSVKGNVMIVANDYLTINNIYASGNIQIINNPDGYLTIAENMITDREISMMNETSGKIQIQGVTAAGEDITISNKKESELLITNTLTSTGSLAIENNEGTVHFATPVKEHDYVYIRNSILLANSGTLSVDHHLYAEGASPSVTPEGQTLYIESTADASLNGNIYSGSKSFDSHNTSLIVRDSEMSFTGDLFSEGPLNIRGDQSDSGKEDDNLIADGVMYAKGKTTVSNLNILGKDDEDINKQLILLSGDDLTITRINEFSNFEDPEEKTDNYLPDENNSEQTNIVPLKAFFYTDKKAELYGVGSLFYINGGLFAKGDMTVNGIRGTVESESSLLSKQNDQNNHLSRFMINYNDEIMLQYIDSLPKVEYLSIYSGELTVE
ncbi:hypothetical protein JOC78_001880 [Bacillus ectoiniformans]|uniref:hypothetical protein n=1 Tax=Bacillus ectoiniformans TaxID=1494429 RepID=UPI00195C8263|nr:hypothetical protein [Bacillus ectoiniformans]MBM7648930.1 hypothetical protein [Bacillus ectoiniformans]